MESLVRIVNYHYVRPIKGGKYPKLKGIEVGDFDEQVRYLKRKFNLIGIEELIASIEGASVLPDDAAMLSFDDGYSDHFEYVYPILRKLGIRGCFFLPVKAISERRMLEVNMIQIILAKSKIEDVVSDLKYLVEKQESDRVKPWVYYREKYAKAGRFDEAEVVLVKKLLQSLLPADIRSRIIGSIWEKRVGELEKEVADEWYLNLGQIHEMRDGGMYFGNHSYSHEWLDNLSFDEMSNDIFKADNWLDGHFGSQRIKTLCYPYGRFNDSIVEYLNKNSYQAAFTTEGDVARIEKARRFELPRLDTNQVKALDKID